MLGYTNEPRYSDEKAPVVDIQLFLEEVAGAICTKIPESDQAAFVTELYNVLREGKIKMFEQANGEMQKRKSIVDSFTR